MAKKSTKKETLEAQIEKQIKEIEASNDKIESTENNPTIETIVKSINSVDVEIKDDSEQQIQDMTEKIIETLTPLKELSNEKNESTFEEQILKSNSKENLEDIINKEIETTKEIIKKVEKIKNNINSNTKTGFTSITNWWNGMGYDF